VDQPRARIAAVAERVRTSLFFVPSAFVVGAIVLGQLSIELDERFDVGDDLPFTGVAGTVESARAVLSTVAGATITVAGIAFSISLLVIQLASTQYSPRVVHGLFRDPFNKWAIGVVVGTFTFCLVVLRAVRAPSDGGDPVVPTVSVTVGVLLGIASILIVIAFINHNAHAVDVSEILGVTTQQGLEAVRSTWTRRVGASDADLDAPSLGHEVLARPGFCVRFTDTGWIQHLDVDRLGHAADPGGVVRFESAVGQYAIAGAPLCTIWPHPGDEERARRVAARALGLGNTRSLSQDPMYAVRQIADVGIKALSPGVNDPTTAQDAIFHLGTLVSEFLGRRPPPSRHDGPEGRAVLLSEAPDHADVVALAFAELRRAAAQNAVVCTYIFETLVLIERSLEPDAGRHAAPLLHEQARRLVTSAARALEDPDDVDEVRREYAERFTGLAAGP